MIKFAVVGSNWITEKFIDATNNSPNKNDQVMQLCAVYSRDKKRAKKIADKFSAVYHFDDLDELAQASGIDAVYIASPNSLHYAQSKQMLENGKHVICEKPLSSNYNQACELYAIAKENKVIFFEAYMTAHLPNFHVIEENLSVLGKIRKAHINYCQYSSRYEAYLSGENPNTFNPLFSSGSIMDIGYYCIAFTIALFGKPNRVNAEAFLLDSGVDGCGTVMLDYGDFSVTVDHSKISNSAQMSEIQGEKGVLLIKHIALCEQVMHLPNGTQERKDLSGLQHHNSMRYEVNAFVEQINKGVIDLRYAQRALDTSKVIQEIRRQTGVIFPNDPQ